MNNLMRLLALAAASAALTTSAHAQIQAISGKWSEVRLQERATDDPMCRYLDVEQRFFDLRPGLNRTVQGNFARSLLRVWLFTGPACVLPGNHESPGYYQRSDTWSVTGEQVSQEVLKLKAVHLAFKGDPLAVAPTDFETEFRRDGARVYEASNTSDGLIRLLQPTSLRESEAASADEALRPLMQSLMDGNCNDFYNRSVHADLRFHMPVDQMCKVMRPIGEILTGTLYDKGGQAWGLSLGTVRLGTGARLQPDGDVFVARSFVLDNEGANLSVAAVLRRDSDGAWKIAHFF